MDLQLKVLVKSIGSFGDYQSYTTENYYVSKHGETAI